MELERRPSVTFTRRSFRTRGRALPIIRRRFLSKLRGKRGTLTRLGLPQGRRLLPMERKVLDFPTDNLGQADGVNTTGVITLINGVATGDDFTNRDGRKATMVSLLLTGFFNQDAANLTADNLCRILVIYDKKPTGALPAVADILTAASSMSAANLNNRDRFVTLVDEIFMIGRIVNTATQAFAAGPCVHNFRKFLRFKLPMTFTGTDATIASFTTGATYVLTIGNTVAGTTDGNCRWQTRIRFVDN